MKWKAFLSFSMGFRFPGVGSDPGVDLWPMTRVWPMKTLKFTKKQSLFQMNVGWGSWFVPRFSWINPTVKLGPSYLKPFWNVSKSAEATSTIAKVKIRGNCKSKNLSQSSFILVKKMVKHTQQFVGHCRGIVWVYLTIL